MHRDIVNHEESNRVLFSAKSTRKLNAPFQPVHILTVSNLHCRNLVSDLADSHVYCLITVTPRPDDNVSLLRGQVKSTHAFIERASTLLDTAGNMGVPFF